MKTDPQSTFTKNSPPTNGRARGHYIFQGMVAVTVCTAICIATFKGMADDQPVLTISPLGGNQFSIAITNGTSPTNYLLEWAPILADTNYPWLVVATNTPGQTNFMMDASAWPKGFFRVLMGDGDVDSDGVPSWMDAQPFNGAVGALTVVIDSPLNGTSLY